MKRQLNTGSSGQRLRRLETGTICQNVQQSRKSLASSAAAAKPIRCACPCLAGIAQP